MFNPKYNNILDDDLSIDLTPLIDVIFMLLVFFIMTTTFSKPIMEIVLPTAEFTEELENKDQLVLSVTKEGAFFYRDTQMTLQGIVELFEKHPDSTVNFYVDKEAPFEAFVQVIDKAKAREGGNFVISTEVQ